MYNKGMTQSITLKGFTMNSFDNIQCDDFLNSDDFLAWAADLDDRMADYDDCDDLDPIHEDEFFFSTGGQCWDE
jgi:hypothetical protein